MGNYFNEKLETMSRDEMRALQSQRLVDTVRRVYDHVAPYRAKMDTIGLKPEDIRSVDDLSKLPFTTKQDLRDNYPYGMFAVPQSEVAEIHASSGTTGKQTVVGYTAKDLQTWGEIAARAIVAAGGSREDYLHISYGYGLFTGGLGLHYGGQKMGASVIPVSTGNTKRQIQIMQDFGSTILACTPSYALYLGETIEEMGLQGRLHLKSGAAWASRPTTSTACRRSWAPAWPLSAMSSRGCMSARTTSSWKSSTPTPAKSSPRAAKASWSSPASPRKPSP